MLMKHHFRNHHKNYIGQARKKWFAKGARKSHNSGLGPRPIVKFLLNTASQQNRVCLNSISASHAEAWLRATPNSNLGLSMSPHEFVIAIRLSLGIKMFPSPPASVWCSCGQHIDAFGDHIVGSGFGPEHTRSHNALAEDNFKLY